MEQRRTIVGGIVLTARRERRACRWLGLHRSAVRYAPEHRDDAARRARLRELAEAHPRWGAPMRLWKLRQAGIMDNHTRVRRLSRLEGLAVRRRGRTRVAVARVAGAGATQPNEHWAMDFVRDTRADGRAVRALILIDACPRECPVIEVDVSLGGARVVGVLARLRLTRGLPQRITVTTVRRSGARRAMPGRISMACSSSAAARGTRWTTP